MHRELDAWFVTGGSKSGIMEIVGEARARFNPKAPLIGIAGLGTIAGGERLRGIDILKAGGFNGSGIAGSSSNQKGWLKPGGFNGSGIAGSSSKHKGWQLFGYYEGVFCVQRTRLQRHFYYT